MPTQLRRPTAALPHHHRILAIVRAHLDRRRMLALLLAIVIGIVTSQAVGRSRQVMADLGPTLPVVLASTDLEPGDTIDAGSVAVQQRPPAFVPPGAATAASDVVGLVVRVPIVSGEVFTTERVTSHRLGLQPDERGITLPMPLAPPPVAVGDVVDLVGVGLVVGTDVVRATPLGRGRVVAVDAAGITVAVPVSGALAVVEQLAAGTVETIFTPFG